MPPRLVLVHGFTQTAVSWRPVADRLSQRFEVVTPELPGHGGAAGVRLDFAAAAAAALGESGGPATYVGYSMGGRLCLRLAVDRPDLVHALVLVGASPGVADPAERAERRDADERLAAGIERDGTAAFLRRWLAGPLFATLRPSADDLAARGLNPPAGLAAALRTLGTGVQQPLWDRLGELAMPVLLVAGQSDVKFAELAERMAAAIGPRARVALVAGAGHAAHLERPDEFCALLTHPHTE
jgi:2-succinyl-6-hydroxy-2,4-cyclohexadiene-1-carboxylate synthase